MAPTLESSASRCLDIAEIFLCIVMHAGSGDRDLQGTNSSLLNLALTCRGFRDAALDELWASLHSLTPLLRLFPTRCGLTTVRGSRSPHNLLKHFTDAPLATEWDRFTAYAGKVQSLGPCPDIGDQLYRILAIHSPSPGPLLPNLRRVHWGTSTANISDGVGMVLHAGITTIDIHLTLFDSDSTMLDCIRARCPLLEELRIRAVGTALVPRLSALLCRQHRLRVLVARDAPVDTPAARHLAGLASLTHLDISTLHDDLGAYMPPAPRPVFPALEALELRVRVLDPSLAVLIARLSARALHTLTIAAAGIADPTALPALLAALGSLAPRAPLHTLSLSVLSFSSSSPRAPAGTDIPSFLLSAPTLRPLLALHTLTALTLLTPHFALDDALLAALAHALPRLRTLVLAGARPAPLHASRATLDGLRPLAALCPALETLWVALDATAPAPSRDAEVPAARASSLSFLGLAHSSLVRAGVPRAMALLAALFPRLGAPMSFEYARTGEEGHEGREGSWAEVYRALDGVR